MNVTVDVNGAVLDGEKFVGCVMGGEDVLGASDTAEFVFFVMGGLGSMVCEVWEAGWALGDALGVVYWLQGVSWWVELIDLQGVWVDECDLNDEWVFVFFEERVTLLCHEYVD